MSDAVTSLPGDPPGWPATLRGLLRDASDGSLDRTTALERLADDPRSGDGTADRRLAFLDDADLLDCEDGACRPGHAGREFLQTHDESVLFEALAAAAPAFESIVETLAIRPLTDVEVVDLLSAERAAELDRATADRYLAWLRALGLLSRDDGVNDLTRAGRRLVATSEGLTPPGTEDADPPAEGAAHRSPDGPARPAAVTDESGPTNAGSATSDPDATATDADPDATDAELVVDADLERDLRTRYDDTCMLCGERRQRGPDAGYAEVHFLMPRTAPHDGPADPANALVVCPNHRADLEHGTVTVDPQSLTVEHAYESTVTGRTLLTVEGHDVGAQYLAYHNDVIAGE